jgi:hypothetical protein
LTRQRPQWAIAALQRIGTLAGLTFVILFWRLSQNKQDIQVWFLGSSVLLMFFFLSFFLCDSSRPQCLFLFAFPTC